MKVLSIYMTKNIIYIAVLLLSFVKFVTMSSAEQLFAKLRNSMVQNQIISRGVRNLSIIEAMKHVPRHKFGNK